VDSWREVTLDHGLTKYPLVGGHARISCAPCHLRTVAACHRPEIRNGVAFVRYKPLPTTCRGCHGGSLPPTNGERR
jgi:hypothetical protein